MNHSSQKAFTREEEHPPMGSAILTLDMDTAIYGMENSDDVNPRQLFDIFNKWRAFNGSSAQMIDVMRRTKIGLKRDQLVDYYNDQHHALHDFFKDRGYTIAAELLELIITLKTNKWRRDGFTPDYGHEIDQSLPLMGKILHDEDFQKRMVEAEKLYGSIELWFCSILIHDLAEDFGFFPVHVKEKIFEQIGRKLTDAENEMLEKSLDHMEVLTHYRKLSPEQFEELVGEKISAKDLKGLKRKGIIPLPHLRDKVWSLMDRLDESRMDVLPEYVCDKAGNPILDDETQQPQINNVSLRDKNLQVYAIWDEKKKKPVINVTRYGKTSMDHLDPQYGADWNTYSYTCRQYHIYTGLTKLGDRGNGVATRIAVDDGLQGFVYYLDDTIYMIDTTGWATAMFGREHPNDNPELIYYPNSPLEIEGRSMGHMVGLLVANSIIVVRHHESRNPPGVKGSFAFNALTGGGKSQLHFSQFDRANDMYKYTPRESHPVSMQLRQLRNISMRGHDNNLVGAYHLIENGYAVERGSGLAQFTQKPEGFKTLQEWALEAEPEPSAKLWLANRL